MNWHMKEVKAFSKLVLEAKKKGQTYLGPTPLSKIVTYKGEAVANEFSDLLDLPLLTAGAKVTTR